MAGPAWLLLLRVGISPVAGLQAGDIPTLNSREELETNALLYATNCNDVAPPTGR